MGPVRARRATHTGPSAADARRSTPTTPRSSSRSRPTCCPPRSCSAQRRRTGAAAVRTAGTATRASTSTGATVCCRPGAGTGSGRSTSTRSSRASRSTCRSARSTASGSTSRRCASASPRSSDPSCERSQPAPSRWRRSVIATTRADAIDDARPTPSPEAISISRDWPAIMRAVDDVLGDDLELRDRLLRRLANADPDEIRAGLNPWRARRRRLLARASATMRANRPRNTGPERAIRRELFARGLRYRIHRRPVAASLRGRHRLSRNGSPSSSTAASGTGARSTASCRRAIASGGSQTRGQRRTGPRAISLPGWMDGGQSLGARGGGGRGRPDRAVVHGRRLGALQHPSDEPAAHSKCRYRGQALDQLVSA